MKAILLIAILALAAFPTRAAERFYYDDEIKCLVDNLYHEARGEPTVGIIAVGKVVLNRVESKQFPNTVCEVVKQGGEKLHGCQFSWFCDGKSDAITDHQAWEELVHLSHLILDKRIADPSNGSLWYHTLAVNPKWAARKQKTVIIESHIFYR